MKVLREAGEDKKANLPNLFKERFVNVLKTNKYFQYLDSEGVTAWVLKALKWQKENYLFSTTPTYLETKAMINNFRHREKVRLTGNYQSLKRNFEKKRDKLFDTDKERTAINDLLQFMDGISA